MRCFRRKTPLLRSAVKLAYPPRRDRSDEFASFVVAPSRAVMASRLDEEAPVEAPKESVERSEVYLRLVASLDCIHCGRKGPGVCQAAHADMGKGQGIKTDDRTAFPLCATTPERPGCHDIIGASGAFKKEHRRTLEERYGAATRAAITLAGKWPPGLPAWPS